MKYKTKAPRSCKKQINRTNLQVGTALILHQMSAILLSSTAVSEPAHCINTGLMLSTHSCRTCQWASWLSCPVVSKQTRRHGYGLSSTDRACWWGGGQLLPRTPFSSSLPISCYTTLTGPLCYHLSTPVHGPEAVRGRGGTVEFIFILHPPQKHLCTAVTDGRWQKRLEDVDPPFWRDQEGGRK